MAETANDVFSSLQKQFRGDLLQPGNHDYEEARAIWNGMVAKTPGLIARCADVGDVQTAVRTASAAGIATAVRCGGHSLAGFSTCDGGLVIDLSRMRRVTLDPDARRAKFEGGCLLGSIDNATQQAGLVFPSGVVSHTGAAGLVLGGGTGWLTRRFGLSCDNVEGLGLVTADGSLVRCNARENPDLFWALRGGGGNFGVVTEFQVRLHPVTSVLFGKGMAFGDNAFLALRDWRDFMPEAPDNLRWGFSLQTRSDTSSIDRPIRGIPAASATALWVGDI